MAHNPECGLDCVSAGAVRLDNPPSADQQTGRQHLSGDQSAECAMDERTLIALKGSIAKWESIVAGTEADEGFNNCPLCKEFYHPFPNHCRGCPVRDATGETNCGGSPYTDWADLTDQFNTYWAVNPELVEAAKAELDFLRSLLPEVK
jgi:hypothetical protein